MINLDLVPSAWAIGPENWTNITANEPATIGHLQYVFQNIVSVVLALAGIACFLMLLVGGFRFLTAGGDPKAAASAKGTLTYAILGLVLLVGTWLILKLLETFTGVSLTKFVIIQPSS
jgi:hypothetical protein